MNSGKGGKGVRGGGVFHMTAGVCIEENGSLTRFVR